MNFRRNNRLKADLNLTPMIDIVFLLVIFFMVSTTFITARSGIKVDLPHSRARKLNPSENLMITIPSDGELEFNGQKITMEELERRLKETHPRKMVIIEADKKVTHGRVVEIMDLVKECGNYKLAIATQPKKSVIGE